MNDDSSAARRQNKNNIKKKKKTGGRAVVLSRCIAVTAAAAERHNEKYSKHLYSRIYLGSLLKGAHEEKEYSILSRINLLSLSLYIYDNRLLGLVVARR